MSQLLINQIQNHDLDIRKNSSQTSGLQSNLDGPSVHIEQRLPVRPRPRICLDAGRQTKEPNRETADTQRFQVDVDQEFHCQVPSFRSGRPIIESVLPGLLQRAAAVQGLLESLLSICQFFVADSADEETSIDRSPELSRQGSESL